VAISTAYWPMLWPQPEAATLTLRSGGLDLPVRQQQAEADEAQFEPAESAPPLAQRQIRAPAHARRSETDHHTGEVSLIIEDDFGLSENGDHGLVWGGAARERWVIHPDDPLSARGHTHWTEETRRGEVHLRTETFAEMWSDAENFHLTARVEAWENDILVYDRHVTDTIPRDHM